MIFIFMWIFFPQGIPIPLVIKAFGIMTKRTATISYDYHLMAISAIRHTFEFPFKIFVRWNTVTQTPVTDWNGTS